MAAEEHERREQRPPDPAALFMMLDGMRRMAPRELEGQVTNLISRLPLSRRTPAVA